MSTTLDRPRPQSEDPDSLRLNPTRRRRPGLIAASGAVLALCVAVFTNLYLSAGHRVSVLAVARAVPVGAVLGRTDLSVTRVSISGGQAIPVSEASSVVGRRAAVGLVPGSLLVAGDVTSRSAPPPGLSVVGVAVKPGQVPAGGLVPGDAVDVVFTSSPGVPLSQTDRSAPASDAGGTAPEDAQGAGPGSVIASDVSVQSVSAPAASSGSDTSVVSLVVPSTLAPLISNASVAGQAALVIVGPGS